MDAANIDLKGFTEDFYHKACYGHLQSVLETLVYVKRETQAWLEFTTLLIPGLNDSDAELEQMTMGGRESWSRRTVALHGFPSGLANERHCADAKRNFVSRPPHRDEERCALCLYRERP
jgi:pyruvate-formate lyase-activating enzyme